MTPADRLYWPFDVLPLHRQTQAHRAEIDLLKQGFELGFRPYINRRCTEIGFGTNAGRAVLFVSRGRDVYWEPWPSDRDEAHRLGPVFDLPESACISLISLDAVAEFAWGWMAGESLRDSVRGLPAVHRLQPKTLLVV